MSYAQAFEFTDAPEVGQDDYVADVPAGIASTQSLLQVLYNALELPGYFGFNWDALSDCLRDFHWLKQHRIVLRHVDVPLIPTGDLRTYLEVLSEAGASWGPGEDHSLKVVFPAGAEGEVTRLTTGTSHS
jgi:hypothetical protein